MGKRSRVSTGMALAVLLFSCTGDGTASPSASAGGASAAGGTLRVAMVQPAYQGFDPQASYTTAQWEVLRCCLVRTLMTYPGVPDYPGTQPVPDLAAQRPTVSADGMTWTFHVQRGLHYAPPLQDVEIRSEDFVRALLRAGSKDAAGGPGEQYLQLIQGFTEYVGGAAAIAGVSTPDAFTLRVQETRPDRSIEHLFAMPFTAPLPATSENAGAPYGVATGHPFANESYYQRPPNEQGYGPFLVASGPYMVEGSQALDPSRSPSEQEPVAGLVPVWTDQAADPGTITLVRNPSWTAASDPNRPAFADRIEVSIDPPRDPYRGFQAGAFSTILGGAPPPSVLQRYEASSTLRSQIVTTTYAAARFALLNVAKPPFDDPHVRAAVALALDRTVLLKGLPPLAGTSTAVSHIIPDPMDASLLASWDPFSSTGGMGDIPAARAEMSASSYASSGRCSDAACRDVSVVFTGGVTRPNLALMRAMIAERFAALGMHATFPDAAFCGDGPTHEALCVGFGWGADYPDAGNMLFPDLSAQLPNLNRSLLGATPQQLRRWHYATTKVPSIDADHARCASQAGTAASLCWARLDQFVVGRLAAVIPLMTTDLIRLKAPGVTSFSLDQAFGEPSLDRIAVGG